MKRRSFIKSSLAASAASLPLITLGCKFEKENHANMEKSTVRPLAISTSNFCGPQFVGMWRDLEWHKRLTDLIKNSPIDKDLHGSSLLKRMAL